MRRVLRAEWLKAWTGKSWWVLTAVGVPWILLVVIGERSADLEALDKGTMTTELMTTDLVKQWFQTFLFTSLFGALVVTRELNAKTIGRTVLLGDGRMRVFWAKAIVATAVGLLGGLLAALLAVAATWVSMATAGSAVTWSSDTTATLVGVVAVSALAAPWGCFIAWIVREQVAAIAFLLVQILLVEPGLQHFGIGAARATFSIALSAIYRDGKPELLAVPWAVGVVLCWLAVAGAVGRLTFTRRDIP